MFRYLILGLALTTLAQAQERTVPVEFTSDGVALSGTLVLPAGDGPHPAFVFAHGSGPQTREGPLSYSQLFTASGVALLAFDKRGTGDSEGSWINASLHDLAGDVARGIEHLRTLPQIDAGRIGIWGISQGGWVAPLAATMTDDVAFLFVVSGGGATPLQSELHSYRHAFEQADLSPDQQAAGWAAINDYFWYLATGQGRADLEGRLANAESQPWYRHAPLGRIMPSEANRSNWAWVAEWDPLLSIARFDGPVLLLFGGEDKQHPVRLAVERWRQGLSLGGNDDLTVRVFDQADHHLRLPAPAGERRGPMVPDYEAVVADWLATAVVGTDR